MENADGCIEMIEAHESHLRSIQSNIPLFEMISILREWKNEKNIDIEPYIL